MMIKSPPAAMEGEQSKRMRPKISWRASDAVALSILVLLAMEPGASHQNQ
jgi:hypothetical protein